MPRPGEQHQRKHLPSVTEILTAANLGVELNIPDSKLAYVLQRGTALHSAIELDLAGELDEASVHESIAGRLAAFRKFSAAVRLEPIATEIELEHPAWRFMGHPDLVALVNGRRCLLDWKAGHYPLPARRQIAGYQLLWEANRPDEPIEDYLVVTLHADGRPVVYPVDPTPARQTFLAALTCWYARKETA